MALSFGLRILTAVGVIAFAGCATMEKDNKPVAAGDRVAAEFTCRFPDGEVAATTSRRVADDAGQLKSKVFMPPKEDQQLPLIAGKGIAVQGDRGFPSFEEEIAAGLAAQVIGMRSGESRSVVLHAKDLEGSQPLKMAVVRQRPKEMRVARARFLAQKGKEPEEGQDFVVDPLIPGKVVKVEGEEVLVRFAAKDGTDVETPFGPGTIRETPERYEIVLHPRVGSLVRSGPLVGRITRIDERMFIIDYRNPFGGEPLSCDVRVAAVEHPGMGGQTSAGSEAERQAAVEKLGTAITQATLKGATSVNIDMDDQAGTVQPGDLVQVNYTATLDDGSLVRTTLAGVSGDPARKRVAWYEEPKAYLPEEVVAGKESELFGMGEVVVGMAAGEKKHLVLPAGKAFPMPNPADQVRLPRVKSLPTSIRMPAEEYAKRFKAFPAAGKVVELVPYFKARVAEVTDYDVRLDFLAKDGAQFSESYGAVAVGVAGDTITITLTPRIGAPFPAGERTGLISAADDGAFTVDFNHPLSGKPVTLDVEVVSFAKADTFKGVSLPWVEDHDKALAAAKQAGKPAVLVLYAEWCQWCKKTFAETLQDPRIKEMKESFVWAKVNSNQQAQFKEKYGQNGFPLIVLLHPDGTVAGKIEGFRDGAALAAELRGYLAGGG